MKPAPARDVVDLREWVIGRARAGDSAALELLIRLVPRELPPSACRVIRDDAIRALGRWLVAAMPGGSVYARARLIAAAGREMATRRGLPDRAPFAVLDHAERARLAGEMQVVLAWGPCPRWRRIIAILGG